MQWTRPSRWSPPTGVIPNTALERRLGEGEPEEYGLALSAGGIRATLFHYGALIRINELGHLRGLRRVGRTERSAPHLDRDLRSRHVLMPGRRQQVLLVI
jgi:hypothetical protein